MSDFLYPSYNFCTVCLSELDASKKMTLCDGCIKEVKKITDFENRCMVCGKPVLEAFEALLPYRYKCKACQEQFSFLKAHRTYALYEGPIKKMLMDLKYHDRTHHLAFLVETLCETIENQYKGIHFDLITCVPIHWTRLLKRQYNQAALLAKMLSKRTNIPYAPLLSRNKRTKRLKLLTREERKSIIHGVISLKTAYKNHIRGKNILIIDDIYTTGATLNECARVFYEKEAAGIYALTVATGHS